MTTFGKLAAGVIAAVAVGAIIIEATPANADVAFTLSTADADWDNISVARITLPDGGRGGTLFYCAHTLNKIDGGTAGEACTGYQLGDTQFTQVDNWAKGPAAVGAYKAFKGL